MSYKKVIKCCKFTCTPSEKDWRFLCIEVEGDRTYLKWKEAMSLMAFLQDSFKKIGGEKHVSI